MTESHSPQVCYLFISKWKIVFYPFYFRWSLQVFREHSLGIKSSPDYYQDNGKKKDIEG